VWDCKLTCANIIDKFPIKNFLVRIKHNNKVASHELKLLPVLKNARKCDGYEDFVCFLRPEKNANRGVFCETEHDAEFSSRPGPRPPRQALDSAAEHLAFSSLVSARDARLRHRRRRSLSHRRRNQVCGGQNRRLKVFDRGGLRLCKGS